MLPLLKLPAEGESITIKILERAIPDPRKRHRDFGEYLMKCCISGKDEQLYYLELRPFIIKEITKECKNNNMFIDKDLNCAVGRIFSIFGKRSITAPKRIWRMDEVTNKLVPPMVHIFKLNKRIE